MAVSLISPGLYVKHDGGVRFELVRQPCGLWFEFRSSDAGQLERQPIILSDSGDAFSITWQWGNPTFFVSPDGGTLRENGEAAFILQAPRPLLSAEQMCGFRDVGIACVHGAVRPSLVRAALQCEDVRRAIADACDGPPGGWASSVSSSAALLDLAAALWPTVCALLGEATPFPPCAQLAVKAPGSSAALPGALPAGAACVR